MRFVFEQDKGLVCYEVGFDTPWLDVVPQPFDVRSRMDADGISFSEIAEKLRRCGERHTDVESISVHYTGRRYSVVVVLCELSEERLSEIYANFEHACESYGGHRPAITVLGPKQRDCFVLSAVDSHRVYLNTGAFKTPAIPPLR